MKIREKKNIEDQPINSGYLLGRLELMKKGVEKEKQEELSSEDNQHELSNQLWRKEEQEAAKNAETSFVSTESFNRAFPLKNEKYNRRSIYRSFLESKSNQTKDIVHEHKIASIVNNFAKKIKRNISSGKPIEFQPFDKKKQENQIEHYGLELPSLLEHLIFVVSFLHTLVLCLIGTLLMTFKQAIKDQLIEYFDIGSVIWMVLEIGLGFVRVTYIGSIKLEKLKEISVHYLKGQFIIDVLCVGVLFASFFPDGVYKRVLGVVFFLKIPDALEKLSKLEVKFLDTTYKEHWWDLIKVFLTNFLFAHLLAVILIMMSWIDEDHSWLQKIGAATAPWYERYSWAYYGGTTIMLTVGFGDIAAGNYKEALCLTIIETLSCIALAYNIHCVGTLISNIRMEEIQKNKKLKLLRNLSEKNDIPKDLTSKINNYIQQSSNIKKNFNFEENKNFIESLPISLKSDFLRESHKKVFSVLPFFRNLTQTTLVKLAEKLQMTISHPDQVILKKKQWEKIIILKNGDVVTCVKMKDSKFNHTLVDTMSVKDGENPKLLSLQFISPERKEKNYQMKSKTYSILYSLNIQHFHKLIKEFQYDFQYFHQKKDSQQRTLGEYEVIDCEYCNEKHSKFQCPKLHFSPLYQHVIHKYLFSEKQNRKNQRKKFQRINKKDYHEQLYFKSLKGYRAMNQSIRDTCLSSIITLKTLKNLQEKQHVSLQKLAEDKKKVDSLRQAEFIKQMAFPHISEGNQSVFWANQCDKLQDYKFYFSSFNPKKIKEKYHNRKQNSRKQKKKISRMIMKNFKLK